MDPLFKAQCDLAVRVGEEIFWLNRGEMSCHHREYSMKIHYTSDHKEKKIRK